MYSPLAGGKRVPWQASASGARMRQKSMREMARGPGSPHATACLSHYTFAICKIACYTAFKTVN
jgi:hypothetical protein